jgi:hypothetical protein
MLTTSQFRDFVITQTAGRLSDMPESQFVVYLNQAVVNRYQELKRICPNVYSKKTTIVANGQTATLPTDFKLDQELILMEGVSERWESIIPTDWAWLEAGEIRFAGTTNQSYTLRYSKKESQYVSGDIVEETSDAQAKHLLAEEIKALYYEAFNEGRAVDSSVNALTKSNRIS